MPNLSTNLKNLIKKGFGKGGAFIAQGPPLHDTDSKFGPSYRIDVPLLDKADMPETATRSADTKTPPTHI